MPEHLFDTGRLTDSALCDLAAQQTDLSLYIHIPFCRARCAYCSFFSRGGQDPDTVREYARGILSRLHYLRTCLKGVPLRSAYLGGGDPGLLPSGCLADIAGLLRDWLGAGGELTLECSPGEARRQGAHALAGLGLDRLSCGVQSFDHLSRRTLGRVHPAPAGFLADLAHALRERGTAFSLDLMYGFTGDRPSRLLHDIDRALATGARHLSIYDLMPGAGPRSPAHTGPRGTERLQRALRREVRSLGLQRYELSNYHLRNARECLHNTRYWEYRPYLGLGTGAASMLYSGSGVLNATGTTGAMHRYERLSGRQAAGEMLLSGLRWRGGVDLRRLRAFIPPVHQQVIAARLTREIAELCDTGLLTCEHDMIRVPEFHWAAHEEPALRLWRILAA